MEENDQNETVAPERPQNRPPIVETKIGKSKDGKWVIHRTIITDIKAAAYYRQVLQSD